MDGDGEGGEQLFLSERDVLDYADNTDLIMHSVERIGDDNV